MQYVYMQCIIYVILGLELLTGVDIYKIYLGSKTISLQWEQWFDR